VSPNTGKNDTAMIRSEKKIAGVTSLRGLGQQPLALLGGEVGGRVLELLVRGLDHHDLGVDGGADRDGDAPEGHDRRGDPEEVHGDEGREHRERDRDDRQERAAQVEQEQDDHERDDDHLLVSAWRSVSIARSMRPARL
jgi:hypothetical protein